MSLESLALLSQIVGAIAVIASLIFVGIQIREQANATRAQTEQAIAANWMALTQVIADNADPFAAGLVSTSDTLAELGDGGRLRFLSAMFALFKHYENMYLQFTKRRISHDEWELGRTTFRCTSTSPACRFGGTCGSRRFRHPFELSSSHPFHRRNPVLRHCNKPRRNAAAASSSKRSPLSRITDVSG